MVAAAKTNLEGEIYNIGSPKRVSLEEMKRGNNQGLFPKDNESEITFDPSKPDTLKSLLDCSKTKDELGYNPEYTFVKMMQDFKIEMEEQPFSKLWGTSKDYDQIYKKQIGE